MNKNGFNRLRYLRNFYPLTPALSRERERGTIILLFAMLLSGCLSVYFGKELQWDIAAYHYYNPYAILNGRWSIDHWQGSNIQLFFNPTLDFLHYFLINHFSPFFVEFILGAIHGINFWLIFYICKNLLDKTSLLVPLALAFVGFYGPISISEVGSFMGDNLISLFVLASVALQLNYFRSHNRTLLLGSGFVLGMGIGLKLPAGIYLIGFVCGFLFLPIPITKKCKLIFYWGVAAALGILLSLGWWMVFLWNHFHSPLFPLFNAFLHHRLH